MSKKEILLLRLEELAMLSEEDPEAAHCEADDALIDYIEDFEIKKAFDKINKWYA